MRNILQQLLEAAQNHDLARCDRLVTEAFAQLTPDQSITIASEQLEPHFVVFERYHPEIEWPRQWFGYVMRRTEIDYTSAPFGLYDEDRIYDSRGISSPGSSSFLEAIGLLDSAFRSYLENDARLCLDLAGESVKSVFGARESAFWAEHNSQAYEAYMSNPNTLNPPSEEEVARIKAAVREYNENLEMKEFRKSLYDGVVREIEKILDDAET